MPNTQRKRTGAKGKMDPYFCDFGSIGQVCSQMKRLHCAFQILNLAPATEADGILPRFGAISFDLRFVSPTAPEKGIALYGCNTTQKHGATVYQTMTTLGDFVRMSSESVLIESISDFYDDIRLRRVEDRLGTAYVHNLLGVYTKDSSRFSDLRATGESMDTSMSLYPHFVV